jgi:hypothetical protein
MATVLDQPNKPTRFTSPKERIRNIPKVPKQRDYAAIMEMHTIETNILDLIKKQTDYGAIVVLMTPEMCLDVLSLNDMGQNRHIDSYDVEKYEGQMKIDKWKDKNGDTICVSKTLKLLDGQHRLWAQYFAGVTLTVLIAVGIDDDAFSYKDIGRKRNAGDIISIRGYQTNAGYLAQVVKSILYYKKESKAKGAISDKDVPNFEVNEFASSIPAMNRLVKDLDYAKAIWCETTNKFLTPAQWVFVYYVLRNLSGREIDARTFMERFADGADLKATSPIKIVRTLFETEFRHFNKLRRKRSNKVSITIKIKAIFEAWNQYIDGAKISELDFDVKDPIIPKPRWKSRND